MQITFDPHDEADRNTVAQIIGLVTNNATMTPSVMTQPTDTVSVTANTPVGAVVTNDAPPKQPTPPEPVAPPAADGETDIHGMVWNEKIHSHPPKKNGDGSWRAKRGGKEEYEAAIAAHKQGVTAAAGASMVAPAGNTVPMPGMPPAPAAPVPQTPPTPITYDEMGARFSEMMRTEQITDYEAVYQDCQIDYTQLEHNQTLIARIWFYMDAIASGQNHRNAVEYAFQNAG